MTELQNTILELMITKPEFETWGFCYISVYEVSIELNISVMSVSNSMRSLYNKGILTDKYANDRYSPMNYKLEKKVYKKLKEL